MEVKIAVRGVAREVVLDTEMSTDEVADAVRTAVEDSVGVLDLTDSKGRRVLVPGSKLGYVEVGPSSRGHVGFATT